ncbi:MAG: marine proteobacterial sortase target protein [Pseudomonadota bacterium]
MTQFAPSTRRLTLRLLPILSILVTAPSLALAQGEPRMVTPNEQTSGTLLLETDTVGKYISAPSLITDVDIDISGPIARTKVTQRFENTSDAWVEGIYVFPLPDESAVDTLRMQIGDRFIEGQIKERQQARKIYEAAKAEGRKASLMEQERANIFTNSVANIGPGETVVVQIEYQETIRIDDGRFSLRFPMVVAPRYNPTAKVLTASIDETSGWAISDPVPDRDRITPPYHNPDYVVTNPVRLTVDIEAGFPLGTLTSSYHEMQTIRDGEENATLTLKDESVPANRDFELVWSPRSEESPRAALFSETIQGEDFYLLMITPPDPDLATAIPARDITFVIDTSGSMGGASIRQARQSLSLAVARLNETDVFNIIEFDNSTRTLFNAPRPATAQHKRIAVNWIEGLKASGGTQMLPALETALRDSHEETGRLKQVIFLTDGAIGNEQDLFDTIAARRGEARIFTVGIGSAPNSFFMSRAAELGRGTFTHIGSVTDVAERMNALFNKLETPAITDLALSWPKGAAIDTSYTLIPDVYQGETLSIAARSDTGSGDVVLTGTSGTQPWEVTLKLDQASPRTGVSKLWARKKIAALELDRARRSSARETLDAAILKIALDHSLISRLTSLVAVDVTPSRPDGDRLVARDVPLNFPEGWDFEKVFGEDGAFNMEAAPEPVVVAPKRAAKPTDASPVVVEEVLLPRTATLSDLKLILGLLLILLSLVALTRRTEAQT